MQPLSEGLRRAFVAAACLVLPAQGDTLLSGFEGDLSSSARTDLVDGFDAQLHRQPAPLKAPPRFNSPTALVGRKTSRSTAPP